MLSLPSAARLLLQQPGSAGACSRVCGLSQCGLSKCNAGGSGSGTGANAGKAARYLNTNQGAGPKQPAGAAGAKADPAPPPPPAASTPAGGGDSKVAVADRPVGPQDYSIAMRAAYKLASVPHGAPLVPGEVSRLSGLPRQEQTPRRVLIFSNSKSPEQQGRQKTAFNRSFPHWSMEYLDPADKWINPLIGWTSSADTKHQAAVNFQFYTAEEAIAFCERQGWEYEIQVPQIPRDTRSRRYAAYGDNFSIKRHGIPDLSHLPSENAAPSSNQNAAAAERIAQSEGGASGKAADGYGSKSSAGGV
ncbi:hypothetical protein CHLRE_16g681700v5 [Chlamydomonas reinhardtii]|uniref:NADH dehydrogenase [ubiquinone] iron-sulfur protein 4, mitochondrial n=1 Tax=Chlamydomonas reinhardtii TaxID=3055 RepID=A0A2K3CV08_CHLRE|nr:uncharacterized protein CHLRE_16g681700v5 [Chlamydomonas reinhardtii]PNW72121.1 hypothetical protein CHLRE_16g681700v5 [Chlamydomonas reinhardtii]